MDPQPDWVPHVEAAITKMWAKLRKHYTKTDNPSAYVDATILHPAKKLHPFRKDGFDAGSAEKYKSEFQERFEKDYNVIAPEPQPPATLKRRIGELDSSSEEEEESPDELELYLKTKRDKSIIDQLPYWRKDGSMFPNLKKNARDIMAIPATGCGVEREFSISGRMVTKHRNRLGGNTIGDLMFFKRSIARGGRGFPGLEPPSTSEIEELTDDDDEDKELKEEDMDLMEWLDNWQKKQKLATAVQHLQNIDIIVA
jgi:hypothetical protein